ncbi:MAG TPA: ATP-dependent DNA helicase [Acidimicrobiales bacterium]|nr:ATP-dependent DNA helicase [Acidimicrobiales bacterium]
MAESPIAAALRRVTSALGAYEERPSQVAMAEAVAEAIQRRRHLVVQAGTGTGKSMGYLVPALALGMRTVVATATKALQDQLALRDLPLVAAHLGAPFEYAVLKGRSNYICRQRVREIAGAGDQLPVDAGGVELSALGREIRRLVAWADTASSGDRAELDWEPSGPAWAQVSVGPRDCPGAARCPSGDDCFAEAARARAGAADVVVVNTHLYATHLAAGGEVLPPHDLVVFDEAHELEDVASSSLGFEVGPGRFAALARSARALLADRAPAGEVDDAGRRLGETLARRAGRRVEEPPEPDLADQVVAARERVATLAAAVRRAPAAGDDDGARRTRTLQAAGHLVRDLDAVLERPEGSVAWVEGPARAASLRVAPIDVGETLAQLLWSGEGAPTGVLTSATIPPHLADRVGLPAADVDELDVGSPFDYARQALLYCAIHLPDPRQAAFERAATDELVALLHAAGGRTLALFTSWRAMRAAAAEVATRVPWPVLTQDDLPKPALVERFSREEHTSLFATMGFWQGVDVPGPSLSLVVMDRLPFPRPDDPLLQARRERLGPAAFGLIDVPRAASLLAQGSGRLIRSAEDRGVVAVLDRRLGTARYRWELVRALPPMRRTRRRADVEAFLAPLREAAAG